MPTPFLPIPKLIMLVDQPVQSASGS